MNSDLITEESIRLILYPKPPENFVFHTASLLRQAAVLMPLVRMNGDWCLVFTRRTQTVQNHKGQVSFPGGAAEPQDYSLENTALREAHEEIGLHPNQVRLLGRMAQMRTITEYLITPVVGITSWPFEMQLSLDEVERVFTIPLDWLADQRNREEKWIVLRNARQDRMVIYHPYDGEILWGITARLTLNLLRLLGLTD